MTRLIKLALAGLLLALASPAAAQSGCGGQFPANQFCGAGGAQGLPGPRLIPAGGTTPINGGTVLGNPTALMALPIATPNPVLGIPGTTGGSLGFAGSASGTATVQAQPASGTPTILWPNASGTVADSATTPLVLNPVTGALTCPTCVTSSGGGAITGAAPIAVSGAGVVSINNGTSVLNPGTGTLEYVLPVQTNAVTSGACTTSCVYAAGDLFKKFRRSNSGSAMSDTLPASSATGMVNGARMTIGNVDATATLTLTAGAGTSIATTSVGPGRTLPLVYDLANTAWRIDDNAAAQILQGTLSPIIIYAAGQSNFVDAFSFSWSPNSAAQVWNNSVGTVGTGTAFVPLSATVVSLPQKFASDVADANPGHPVYLITSAFSGQPISHWLPGTGAPDAYADGVANVSAALAVIGATKINSFLWWQGEADSVPLNQSYIANFTTMMTRFWTPNNSWFPQETPVMVHGIASVADGNNINANANQMNDVLQAVVNADPDKRRFVYTSSLHGSTYWQSGGNSGHMTAQGYYSAGAMSAGMYLHGPGRNTLAGTVTDPVTGFLIFGNPAVAAVPFLFNNNAAAIPTAPTTTATVQELGADGQGAFHIVDAFGNFAGYSCRRADGTLVASTGLLANDLICAFGAQGFDGTNYVSGNKAGLLISAAENWSGTARGTYSSIYNTIPGTNTTAEAIRFLNGSMLVFGTTSGTGTFTWPAVLGTPTWTLPTNSGTFADSASGPLVLNAATGNLTCPTCTAGSLPTTGLTGVLQAAQEPAHTGACTNTAGSLALSCTTNSPISFTSGNFGAIAPATTYFMGTATLTATEGVAWQRFGHATTLSNLYCETFVAPSGSQTATYTVRVNGATPSNSLVSVITGAATDSVADTTHTVTVNAGDKVDIQIVTSATAASSNSTSCGMTATTTSP